MPALPRGAAPARRAQWLSQVSASDNRQVQHIGMKDQEEEGIEHNSGDDGDHVMARVGGEGGQIAAGGIYRNVEQAIEQKCTEEDHAREFAVRQKMACGP